MPLRVKIGDQVLDAPDGLSDANLLLWAKSHAPMQEPTTFSGGFHQRLKGEPEAGGAVGFVEGLPGGVMSGVKGLVTLPFYVVKGLISTIQDMSDPAAAFEKYEQAWKDKPGEVRDTLKQYVKLAQTDPEAFGKEVGALTGSAEAGIAASGLVPMSPKGIAAKIGPKLETLGKRAEFPLMLSGAHELASGNVMQGVGTMMAPSAIKSTGKAIREFGGLRIHPDESAKLEGKFNDAMTNRNVKFADEQAKTAAKGPMPSGARDVDLQPSGAPIRVQAPSAPSTERVPYGGTPTEPATATQKVIDRKTAQTSAKEVMGEGGEVIGDPQGDAALRKAGFDPETIARLRARGAVSKPGGAPIRPPVGTVRVAPPKPAETPATKFSREEVAGKDRVTGHFEEGKGGLSTADTLEPHVVPPTSDFDEVIAKTHVPDIEVVEGGGKPTAARMPIRLAAPARVSAIPDEWLEAYDKALTKTKSSDKSFLGQNASKNDIHQARALFDAGLSPEEAAEQAEMLKAGRHTIAYENAKMNKQMRSQYDREPE